MSGSDPVVETVSGGRTETPDVTVIIPAYNALPYLHRGLESVVAQTLGIERLEVVIVDDGSTDGTGEAVDTWAARYPDVFRVVHATGSGGPATPRNTGLDLARGRYVFFLDADDFLGVEALERLVTAADQNGSDIVLGKMGSETGRGVPTSMFKATDLDVDLYESRVYWTLAALKLFRRDLLEDNGLRFPTQYPNCSDQPFTATAYFRASKISVLSDYDYYFAELRDDDQHVTKSGSVANWLDVNEAMCDLLVREVPDPDLRAALLTRHFQVDLGRAVQALGAQSRPDQEALFARIRSTTQTHLSPAVGRRLSPAMRVNYELVRLGLLDEVVVAAAAGGDPPWVVTIEGDRAYAHLAFFRDPAVTVPDEPYEVTHRIISECAMTSFRWAGSVLHVAGTARLRNVAGPVQVELVLRAGDETGREYAVAASTTQDGTFEAVVDLLSVADGGAVSRGLWEIDARVSRAGLVRTSRLGAAESPDLDRRPSLTWATLGSGDPWSARAFLTPGRRLSVEVGTAKSKVRSAFGRWTADWDGTDLLVSGRTAMRLEVPIALTVDNGTGDVRTYPVHVDGAAISGRVPVAGLPAGTWSVRLRVGTPPDHRLVAVPAQPQLAELTWRRSVPSMVATPVASSRALKLRVTGRGPARVAGAVTRRLPGRLRRS